MDLKVEIERLVSYVKATMAERRRDIEALCERYYSETGRYPGPEQLELLTNYFLTCELSRRNKRGKCPVYTDEQMAKKDRRYGKRISWDHDLEDRNVIVPWNTDVARHEEAKSRGKRQQRTQKQREGKQKARLERRKRIQRAIEENPAATREEIAGIAGVGVATVYRHVAGR